MDGKALDIRGSYISQMNETFFHPIPDIFSSKACNYRRYGTFN